MGIILTGMQVLNFNSMSIIGIKSIDGQTMGEK